MKIYYDTEFLEDGTTIELISIGMVREDGQEYYAVVDLDYFIEDRVQKHAWLMENVWPSLPTKPYYRGAEHKVYMDSNLEADRLSRIGQGREHLDRSHPDVKSRSQIANEVMKFIQSTDRPELWAWYGAYDHVAMCRLWGPMSAIHGKGIPLYTHDLKQECDRLGNPTVPKQEQGEHNALEDARHNRDIDEFLNRFRVYSS